MALDAPLNHHDLFLFEFPRLLPDNSDPFNALALGSLKLKLQDELIQSHSPSTLDLYSQLLQVEREQRKVVFVHPFVHAIQFGHLDLLQRMADQFWCPHLELAKALKLPDDIDILRDRIKNIGSYGLSHVFHIHFQGADKMLHVFRQLFDFETVFQIMIRPLPDLRTCMHRLFNYHPLTNRLFFRLFPDLVDWIQPHFSSFCTVLDTHESSSRQKSIHVYRALISELEFGVDFMTWADRQNNVDPKTLPMNAPLSEEFILEVRSEVYFQTSLTQRLLWELPRY